MARGALDLVDRALDAGAEMAPESLRGALEVASSDVDSVRRSVTANGASAEEVKAQAAEIVAKGDRLFDEQFYIAPRGENAYDTYRRALDLDPDNAGALAGIEKLRAFYNKKAEIARAAKEWDKANRHFVTSIAISKLRPVR